MDKHSENRNEQLVIEFGRLLIERLQPSHKNYCFDLISCKNQIGESFIALTFYSKQSEDKNLNTVVAPTINLYEVFQDYRDKKCTFDDIIGYIEHKISRLTIATEFVTNETNNLLNSYEASKEWLIPILYNKEMYSNIIKNSICVDFNDALCIVLAYCTEIPNTNNIATIPISKEIYETWNDKIDPTEMILAAIQNVDNKYPHQLINLKDVVTTMLQDENCSFPPEIKQSILESTQTNDADFYILTNKIRSYGSYLLTVPEVLKEVAKKLQCDFYILPSSVDELIIVPEDNEMKIDKTYTQERLKAIVEQINNTILQAEQFLCNDIYYYSMSTDCLSIR